MSNKVGGDNIKGSVGDGKNTVIGKNNVLENHDTPVTINNNLKSDADADLDAIRLALFGDSKLNFKGLIMRLDEIETKLRHEIYDLRDSIKQLENQINDLKRNLAIRNTHLVVSTLNLFLIVILFGYLFSQ